MDAWVWNLNFRMQIFELKSKAGHLLSLKFSQRELLLLTLLS